MTALNNLPSYQQLFGGLDFAEIDDGRTVYSPAAYLADLLQLIDDVFDEPDLASRRPDINSIPLDAANAYTLVPYLDIVIERLAALAATDDRTADTVLAEASYPFNLPFDRTAEEIRTSISYLGTSLVDLRRAFGQRVEPNLVARDALGLSPAAFEFVTTEQTVDDAYLTDTFGLPDASTASLRVDELMAATMMSGPELRELLTAGLSSSARNDGDGIEVEAAGGLFVNRRLGGHARLDERQEHVEWSVDGGIPAAWFDRVNRLVRLSRWIGVGLTDLDRILRCCCDAVLDDEAIQTIAVIIALRERTDLDLDVLCALWGDVDPFGVGDADTPIDVFDRTFNGRAATIERRLVEPWPQDPSSWYRHRMFDGFTRFAQFGDILDAGRHDLRQRLASALNVSEGQIAQLVEAYRANTPAGGPLDRSQPLDLPALSVLFRTVVLAEIAEISISDLFAVFDVLGRDPSIGTFSTFDTLVEGQPTSGDGGRLEPYGMMMDNDMATRRWLVQIVLAVADWMNEHDLTGRDLRRIAGADVVDPDVVTDTGRRRTALLGDLVERFGTVELTADALAEAGVDARLARIARRLAAVPGSPVVGEDPRIVRFDEDATNRLAHSALADLDLLEADDFVGLGIAESLLELLIDNLVIRGVIGADGLVDAERLPLDATDFEIAADFTPVAGDVFDVIHGVYVAERSAADSEDMLDLVFYESDFGAAAGSPDAARELYGTMIHLRVLDEEGRLVAPGFFADATNRFALNLDSGLATATEDVHALLRDLVATFEQTAIALPSGAFDDLGLAELDVADLAENLRFNGYLDDANAVVDPASLAGLEVGELRIAPEFHRQRAAVLGALQAVIEQQRREITAVERGDLDPIVDLAVATRVVGRMRERYCVDGRVSDDAMSFFGDRRNSAAFRADDTFDAVQNGAVFAAMAQIVDSVERVRLSSAQLSALGFDASESDAVVEALVACGDVDVRRHVCRDRVDYFSSTANAAHFRLDGFGDDSVELFFAINDVARRAAEVTTSIVEAWKNVAERQHAEVVGALTEHFEMSAPLVTALCRNLVGEGDGARCRLVEQWMAPAYRIVDPAVSSTADDRFDDGYRRITQFGVLVAALRLDERDVDIVVRDQSLSEKFPEPLDLPDEIDGIDALATVDVPARLMPADWWPDGSAPDPVDEAPPVRLLCLFRGERFWAYPGHARRPLLSASIGALGRELGDVERVDAAFVDETGASWLLAGVDYFRRAAGGSAWERQERSFGSVRSNFDDAARIDAAFTDSEERTYLFAGDQYVRYSPGASRGDVPKVDEGYPKTIRDHWASELELDWPDEYADGFDAAFRGPHGVYYAFRGGEFVSSDRPGEAQATTAMWAQVRNNIADADRVDAALFDGDRVHLYAGDQRLTYSSGIEQVDGCADEGSLRGLGDLPEAFRGGVDAAFRGSDGVDYLFRGDRYASNSDDDGSPADDFVDRGPTAESWGRVLNTIQQSGRVDAAFAGLDGRTYVFSGRQYVRYSGAVTGPVDEGYPKAIAGDWAGLSTVDAAFVLDGKTYVFGRHDVGGVLEDGSSEQEAGYLQYSGRDYRVLDEGYPKAPGDNWWNLPHALGDDALANPHAVLVAPNGDVHLFADSRFVTFDSRHRWWSEPRSLAEHWDSVPFEHVDAAFTDPEGRSYLFGGGQYVRYTGGDFTAVDDRHPKDIRANWGLVRNEIARTGRVDAALVVRSHEPLEGSDGERPTLVTYLFSGDQFYRYSVPDDPDGVGHISIWVDEGYPRTIASALRDEPRFANLDVTLRSGVDAAFADDRTAYLFHDGECAAVSDGASRSYTGAWGPALRCAFTDGGITYALSEGKWHRLSGFEPPKGRTPVAVPRPLREVPAAFGEAADAVLHGADGGVRVFAGIHCYDTLLDEQVPIAEEWGRVRTEIGLSGRVDAALRAVDGRIHLFSGDQFVTYTPDSSGAIPRFVDGAPRRIADQWGGLDNVHVAYVRNGVTTLAEAPDEDGRFRYLEFAADEIPDGRNLPDVDVRHGDLSFWDIPAIYVEEGFDRVDAVLVDGDDMSLIRGREFIHYDEAADQWTYPRPLERVWRGLPKTDARFVGVTAVFTAPDATTYFFADTTYVSHRDVGGAVGTEPTVGPIADSNGRWGTVDNRIVVDQRVDAALRHPDGATYLFSGDQFVRYSGDDYRFVDEGYPKRIVESLRDEAPFETLTDEAIAMFESQFALGNRLDAVVSNGRTTSLFIGETVHTCSQSLTAIIPVASLGRLRNVIAETGRVDAALTDGWVTYLFGDDQYVKYTGNDLRHVDHGYPKSLHENGEGWPGLDRVDAAVVKDGATCLFSGSRVIEIDVNSAEVAETELAGRWGVVDNPFVSAEGNVPLDAAFVAPDGSFYAFKGAQFVRAAAVDNRYVDDGYPRTIRDDWGDLPVGYERRIDGGFVLHGRTYLTRHAEPGEGERNLGDEYVRYSTAATRRIDVISPQTFTPRWGPWNDFLVTDLHRISQYATLQRTAGSGSETGGDLRVFLGTESALTRQPYQLLADVFGWDVDEIKWMKRMRAFLPQQGAFEREVDIETVVKMADVFAFADSLGSKPSALYRTAWKPLFDDGDRADANAALRAQLVAVTSEADWPVLARQIHDELNEKRRDALVPYVRRSLGLETTRDLYEHLLIDPEMASCAVTSRIKEAITAVQLYVHRFLVNLEAIEIRGEADDAKRRELKRWWEWMQSYRVWEANRKVFLYPENYIRPELRDTKTPAFRRLEDELMQGEVTEASVSTAYRTYLDSYAEVSRLTIAGGYVYDDVDADGTKQLILFGTTKTDPRRYFYRTGAFVKGMTSAANWGPWLDTGIQIDADRVHPVYAFGRVFVFWATIEERPLESSTTSLTVTEDKSTRTVSGNSPVIYAVRIWFSFHDLNGNWTPPQTLDLQVGDESMATAENDNVVVSLHPIGGVRLFVENSVLLDGHPHENISITCTSSISTGEQTASFVLTPELYTKRPDDRPAVANAALPVFNELFPGETGGEGRAVPLNTVEHSTTGPWFSFDHKGGSFLVKPTQGSIGRDLATPLLSDLVPDWDRVDAVVQGPDETEYYFRDDQFVSSKDLTKKRDIRSNWDLAESAVARDGKVDAVLHEPDQGLAYLFRGDEVLVYDAPSYDRARARPRKISDYSASFPKWKQIGAAFICPNGRRHFFDNDNKQYVSSDDLDQARKTKLRWGQVRNVFTDPATSGVTAAFTSLRVPDALPDQEEIVEMPNARASSSGVARAPSRAAAKSRAASKSAAPATRPEPEERMDRDGPAYLINGTEFVRYSGRFLTFVDPGYPRSGGAKALLEDLGFTGVDDTLADAPVDAAYRDGEALTLYVGERVLTCDLGTLGMRSKQRRGAKVGAAYVNDDHEVQTAGPGNIDAVLVAGASTYVFKGHQYMKLAKIPASFEEIQWKATGPVASRFGRQKTNLATTGVVDGALRDGNVVYLFSGNEYYRYTADAGGMLGAFVDRGYPKRLGPGGEPFPAWNRIGAALRADRKTIWFFEKGGTDFVASGELDTKLPIRERWGIVRGDIVEAGIGAAYSDDKGHVFLVSRNVNSAEQDPAYEFVRYTLDSKDSYPKTVDRGYPKTVGDGRPIDAGFVLDGRLHLVSGDESSSSLTTEEPSSSRQWKPMRGNWGNLPSDLTSGIDAAMLRRTDGSEKLLLVKADRYVEFDLAEGKPRPYEIDRASFDVIRLTTGTSQRLSERLLTGGLDALMSLSTQLIDEIPTFEPRDPVQEEEPVLDPFVRIWRQLFGSWWWTKPPAPTSPTVIGYRDDRIDQVPVGTHLDYSSANGIYYWEVFFHVPMLIARALSDAQRFEDAKRWYEYVYDPTDVDQYWKFLPFVIIDIDATITALKSGVDDLVAAGLDEKKARAIFANDIEALAPLDEVFRGHRELDEAEEKLLAGLKTTMPARRAELEKLRPGDAASAANAALDRLAEWTYTIASLESRYDLMRTRGDAQIRAYQDDPFDPHAIAGLRRSAYAKSVVMAYVDNLLDWGDMLFRRYTVETISEARMLYVLAHDLLGRKPQSLGHRALPPTRAYDPVEGAGLDDGERDASEREYQFLLGLEGADAGVVELSTSPTVHDSIANSYFFIPDNEVFLDYWDRVEDRLFKIRHCLDILGIETPLPLFQPPIDPQALVQAVGSGASLSDAISGAGGVSIPHYRYTFMAAKAQELTQKVSQFGEQLLQALEKRDGEALTVLQNRQEASILGLTREVRLAQLADVEANIASLEESRDSARARGRHYEQLIAAGMIPTEIAQVSLMAAGAAANLASGILKIIAGIVKPIPEVTIGLFSFGAETGGDKAGGALDSAAESIQSIGEGLSMTGEAIGIGAAYERMREEWVLQKAVADSEAVQIEAQIKGARWQRTAAAKEIAIVEREIDHNRAIDDFMQSKFTNEQLYQWMGSRLSATYFRTFKLAHDMARVAEQAFRYERGLAERDASFIAPVYWNGRRKGLLAGDELGVDIDRMQSAYLDGAERRLEISRNISLRHLDPVALLQLQARGECEFQLPEALFDYDFPGHYCRQVRTVSLAFDLGDGSEMMATLTQLAHRTVLAPDPKAVKYLLESKGTQPLSIRSDWRPTQQIALSHVDEYEKNNGLFELRFDDERYLPFEGTGVVSTWRLTLNGKRGSYDLRQLNDVVMNLKYTARQGGDAFATAVKGALKPYLTGVLLDLARDFDGAWQTWRGGDDPVLTLTMTRDMFPDMSSSKIIGVAAHFVHDDAGADEDNATVTAVEIDGGDPFTVRQNGYTETPGLAVVGNGSEWTLTFIGSTERLRTAQLVLIYRAEVK